MPRFLLNITSAIKYSQNRISVILNEAKDLNKLPHDFRQEIFRRFASQDDILIAEVIITIKDPSHQGNIYDGITQKLDEFNFWHSNIKVNEYVFEN